MLLVTACFQNVTGTLEETPHHPASTLVHADLGLWKQPLVKRQAVKKAASAPSRETDPDPVPFVRRNFLGRFF